MNFCYCDCHKLWGSTIPPVCSCRCRDEFTKDFNKYLRERMQRDCIHQSDKEPEHECGLEDWVELQKQHAKPIPKDPELVDINRRLEKLEKRIEALLKELEKSVEELKIKSAHKSNHLLNRIEDLEHEMKMQRKQINSLTFTVEKLEGNQIQEKEPHKCSVCDGTGKFLTDVGHKLIMAGRYKMDEFGRRYIDCEICHSKGIVWG